MRGGEPGWMVRGHETPFSEHHAFLKSLDRVQHGGKLNVPSDVVVLLVQGLHTKAQRTTVGYFHAIEAALRLYGVPFLKSSVRTLGSIRKNAARIRKDIMNSNPNTRWVVYGHSKGAVDAVTALSLYPELLARVLSVCSIQGVHGGSPIAEALGWTRLTQGMSNRNRHRDFLGGLGYTHEAAARTLCVVGSIVPATGHRNPTMQKTSKWIERKHGRSSDGLVCVDDQWFPHCQRYIRLCDFNHMEGASDMKGARFLSSDVCLALLDMVFGTGQPPEPIPETENFVLGRLVPRKLQPKNRVQPVPYPTPSSTVTKGGIAHVGPYNNPQQHWKKNPSDVPTHKWWSIPLTGRS